MGKEILRWITVRCHYVPVRFHLVHGHVRFDAIIIANIDGRHSGLCVPDCIEVHL